MFTDSLVFHSHREVHWFIAWNKIYFRLDSSLKVRHFAQRVFCFCLHLQWHTLWLFHLWKTISVSDENVRLNKCLHNNRKTADETEPLEQQLCLLEIVSG